MGFFLSLVIKMEKNFVLKTLRLSHKQESIEETRNSLLETGELILIIDFVKTHIQYKPNTFIASGATLEYRNAVKDGTLYQSYLNYLEEFHPKRAAENFSNFRDKLGTVFQSLGWSYLDPPVCGGRKIVELKNGGKRKLVGYFNIDWITPKEEELPSPYDLENE
uniref:Uncharacterized protein n=1 Tax=Caulerpa okamurae TaxID=118247 RepID=A0A3S6I2M6_9CHLO|nr:hypothetical protein [Caulerpa okamurae]